MKYTLLHQEARQRAAQACLDAPEGWEVWITKPKRTPAQNRMLHRLLQELEGREWFGKPRNLDDWKMLMVSAHAAATRKDAEIVPGLEGELVALRESTASMTTSRLSSLIEYIQAWMANAGR